MSRDELGIAGELLIDDMLDSRSGPGWRWRDGALTHTDGRVRAKGLGRRWRRAVETP